MEILIEYIMKDFLIINHFRTTYDFDELVREI